MSSATKNLKSIVPTKGTEYCILCRNSRYQDSKYLLDHRVYLARTLHRIESIGLTEKDQFEFELKYDTVYALAVTRH